MKINFDINFNVFSKGQLPTQTQIKGLENFNWGVFLGYICADRIGWYITRNHRIIIQIIAFNIIDNIIINIFNEICPIDLDIDFSTQLRNIYIKLEKYKLISKKLNKFNYNSEYFVYIAEPKIGTKPFIDNIRIEINNNNLKEKYSYDNTKKHESVKYNYKDGISLMNNKYKEYYNKLDKQTIQKIEVYKDSKDSIQIYNHIYDIQISGNRDYIEKYEMIRINEPYLYISKILSENKKQFVVKRIYIPTTLNNIIETDLKIFHEILDINLSILSAQDTEIEQFRLLIICYFNNSTAYIIHNKFKHNKILHIVYPLIKYDKIVLFYIKK
jgi:hypothetical protein